MTDGLYKRFTEAAKKFNKKTAIFHPEDSSWAKFTYADLGGSIASMAAYLRRIGIGKDSLAAIMMDNRPEWPISFFAILAAEAIVVPVSFNAGEEEVEYILKDCGCRALITDLQGPGARFDFVRELIDINSNGFKEVLKKPAVSGPDHQDRDPSSAACILYTSGTTGKPKGVVLTHANLLSNCDSLRSAGLVGPGDVMISVLPLHHIYPLNITMMLPLTLGASIVYTESLRPEAISRAMRRLSPTMFVLVPQIIYSFHKKIAESLKRLPFPLRLSLNAFAALLYFVRRHTGVNLSKVFFVFIHRKFGKRLRFFVSGGAKLDAEIEEKFFKLGFTVIEGYGLTETSPVLTLNTPRNYKIGSAGKAVPKVELKIDKKNGRRDGEVFARGPNIMAGYYNRPEQTSEVLKDGWFHTGDLGYIDRDGFLFLTGRSGEMIVLSSGLNIYPEEIEKAYMSRAPVKQMCVMDVPAPAGREAGTVLWAVVVPDLEHFKKAGEINLYNVLKNIFDGISINLAPHKRIKGFHVTTEDLPQTELGKIKRYEVRETYLPKIMQEKKEAKITVLTEEDAKVAGSKVGRRMLEFLKKETGAKTDISPGDLLELDLGIDSLGRVELASGLERAFGIKIEDAAVESVFTVRELIAAVEEIVGRGEGMEPREISGAPEDYWKRTLQKPPKKEIQKDIDLDPGFGDWLGGALFSIMDLVYFKLFFGLTIEEKENFPKGGPYILYANHTSYLDGPVIAASLARKPRLDLFFIGLRPYFDVFIIRSLIKSARIIPIDFSEHLMEALRSSYYILKNGRNLCLFPEGARSADGSLREFKKGFGILAKESGARLIPVVIKGAYEAWPPQAKFPGRHPIKVRFGKPFGPQDALRRGKEQGAKDDYEAICIGARDVLMELADKTKM